MSDDRLLSNNEMPEDNHDVSLRPKLLKDYIGQDKIKKELNIYIQATLARDEALDHTLIYGPPGLGKTTLAMIMSNELNVGIKTTSGPAIERPGDLIAILNELQPGDILFIDEIHRLPKIVEEVLYSAMEDFYVDIIVGQGTNSQPIHFELPPFTLVGATTKAGSLTQPLRDRFGIILHMQYYENEELSEIVTRSSRIFDVTISEDGANEIALRSRGTPRIANRILKRVRDFSEVLGSGVITKEITEKSLNTLGIDSEGLDLIDHKILKTMIESYHGGPVGLSTIAVNISEDIETVESMYEPYLIQKGYIKRTPRGRMVTKKAYNHLGIQVNNERRI